MLGATLWMDAVTNKFTLLLTLLKLLYDRFVWQIKVGVRKHGKSEAAFFGYILQS